MSLNKKPGVGAQVVDYVAAHKAQLRRYLDKLAGGVFAWDANGLPTAGAAITQKILGAGTAYTLTNTAAAIDLGTTDPVLPALDTAGTYLIGGQVVLNYVAATFAADRTVTIKLRRTNNTAADLTGGSTAFGSGITTTVTDSRVVNIAPTIYTTTAIIDVITIFASVSTVPSAGSMTISAASLVAVRIR